MKNPKFVHSLMAVVLGSMLASGSVLAEESMVTKATNAVDKAQLSLDKTMKKVDGYVDDSSLTAKVKSALLEHKDINSNHVSVATEKGVVTLSGFVESANISTQIVDAVKKVEGVKSVSDKLQVKTSKETTAESYVGDTAVTAKIKAKLLADDIVPSRHVKVETADGVVLLTGTVAKAEQSARAEALSKQVEGVKSVKNELTVK